jgi:urease accessory protein
MTTNPDGAPLLRLLAWLSPAFPTGAYAYSHGLEWAVEAGEVRNGPTLQAWLEDVLTHGAGRHDAILLRHAYRAAADPEALAAIARLGLATQPSRERRGESTGQGNAFALAATAWQPRVLTALTETVGDLPYPVAVGALAATHGIDADAAALGLVQTLAATLISAAVRLVPLGQSTGLAVLAALEGCIASVAEASRTAGLDELGGACFRADIASMQHETQYTRLFRS